MNANQALSINYKKGLLNLLQSGFSSDVPRPRSTGKSLSRENGDSEHANSSNGNTRSANSRNQEANGDSGGECPVHRRLLAEYNRAFNFWVTTEEANEQTTPESGDFERLALMRVEETHQRLLQHDQCCPNCKSDQ